MHAALQGAVANQTHRATVAAAQARITARHAGESVVVALFAVGLLTLLIVLGVARLISRPSRRAVEVIQGRRPAAGGSTSGSASGPGRGGPAGHRSRHRHRTCADDDQQDRGKRGHPVVGLGRALGHLGPAQRLGPAVVRSGRCSVPECRAGVRDVQALAAGSDDLADAIQEIARNATTASQVAAEAVTVTEPTSAAIRRLGESSIEVGNVVKVINSIADQTNLLALNAGRINSSQSAIAGAVEEQSATTAEIGRSMAQAAQGADGIGWELSTVSDAALDTTEGAAGTARAELTTMAGTLRDLVGHFTH